MSEIDDGITRRRFVQTTIAAAGAAALPFGAASAQSGGSAAKYTRYNVMSAKGQQALASYAKGVEAMLKLPPTDPQNWFRNAFVHMIDCPHGNWWFYVWHRGFVGYFEETIRNLSGNPSFAMPYWDWTTLPQIPPMMFDGTLDPQNLPFERYTRNLAVFTDFIKPSLTAYWNTLDSAQLAQLKTRNYTSIDDVWNDVNGLDPKSGNGVSGNIAYATTCGSRYLTRDNPKLDEKTAYDVSKDVIKAGLKPKEFWNEDIKLSFTSSRTANHLIQPTANTKFSILEGMPHNKVHNYIGGVGPLDPGPYGNMTNFLSPVDPIFFLHHSNMDRLWDVWTRKQQRRGLPILPSGADLDTLAKEPFLFYVNGNGQFVGPSHAGDYFSTERFQYDYEPGSGDDVGAESVQSQKKTTTMLMSAEVKANAATLSIPRETMRAHLASDEPVLIAEVRVQRPSSSGHTREFDVLIGAPSGIARVDADSPHYAGTIAFFGHMSHMGHGDHGSSDAPGDATFAVPLPMRAEAFGNLEAASVAVNIRIVPAHPLGKATALKSVSVRAVQ